MIKSRGVTNISPFVKRRPTNPALAKARGRQPAPAVTPNYPSSYLGGGEYATQ